MTSNVTMMDGEVATEAGPLLQLDLTMSLSHHRGREGGHCSWVLQVELLQTVTKRRLSPAVLHAAGWARSGLAHLNTVIT